MHSTVSVPQDLLDELMALVDTNDPALAVEEAIRRYVRHITTRRLIALRGAVDVADNDEIEAWDEAEFRGA
jgi:Arc/MetJ family transcription regulator